MQKTDLKTKNILSDGKKSKAQKYQELIIGKTGWGTLIKYELIMLLCNGLPGVLGLFLRSKLYPMLLGSCGGGVVFGRNVVLRHPHKIHIGDNVVIDDNCMLDAKGVSNEGIRLGDNVFVGRNSILSCKDGDIVLEDHVNMGFNCEIFSSSEVVVGRKTMIAAYCYLIAGNYDTASGVPFAEQDGFGSGNGVHIGEYAWLAADVKVLDDVTIGEHTVVGAGAVVNKSMPANVLAAGVPAKVIRERQTAQNAESNTQPEPTVTN